MNWFAQMWTIASIELRQRVRGAAWYVLLGVFVVVVLIVTVLTWFATSYNAAPGAVLYSVIVFFVLLLGSLVTPALSGNAINGDRENGTLATTQVTLTTTGQLVLGKLLAAWITALAFLVAALPFLLFALVLGGASADTAIISVLVLAVELAVVAAIGVGLSGLMRRPLFSIVTTYLMVALLSVGTLIGFGLGGLASQTTVTTTHYSFDWNDDVEFDEMGTPIDVVCDRKQQYSFQQPRFDTVWWILAANPYVLLADAVPTHYDGNGQPDDAFGYVKFGVRSAQQPVEAERVTSDCEGYVPGPTARETIEGSVPGWAVGLALHVVLSVGLVVGAMRRTHAPARRLAAGSRVA